MACQNGTIDDSFCLGRTLENKWSSCPFMTEDLLSRKVEHHEILDVKLLQISVSFFWQCDPMLRSVCSITIESILLLVLVHRNTNDLT